MLANNRKADAAALRRTLRLVCSAAVSAGLRGGADFKQPTIAAAAAYSPAPCGCFLSLSLVERFAIFFLGFGSKLRRSRWHRVPGTLVLLYILLYNGTKQQ